MRIIDNRVQQNELCDDVITNDTITILQDGNAQTGANGYMPFDGDIVAVTFINISGAAFTAAAKISVTAGDVISSTANLADKTSELKDSGLAHNTGLSKGDAIALTTGTTAGSGMTVVIVEVQAKINSIA